MVSGQCSLLSPFCARLVLLMTSCAENLKFASLRRGVAQGNSLAASLQLTEKPVSKAH